MAQVLEHSHTETGIHDRLARGPRSNYLRDWIYGGIDGAVTTFAIVAGVARRRPVGLDRFHPRLSPICSPTAFAMAASNYIGTKSERDDYERVLGIERRHIALVPDGEREEIRQIFAAKGFTGDDLERAVSVITSDVALWTRTMATEEYGLAPTQRSPVQCCSEYACCIHSVRRRAARQLSLGRRSCRMHTRHRTDILRGRCRQKPLVAR